MAAGWLSPYRWLSPSGTRARLSIFIFHRVLPQPDPLLPDEPDALRFERIVQFIANWFNVMSIGEAARRLQDGALPAASAAISFDDGYADNLKVAAPILKRHGLTATFFIATGYTGGGRMWNDTLMESVRIARPGELDCRDLNLGVHVISDNDSRLRVFLHLRDGIKYWPLDQRVAITDEIAARAGLGHECDLMMTQSELTELKAMGMEIGGHTVRHPILASLDEAHASAEIRDGREQLKHWLGEAPDVFAYPNGIPGKDYTERDVRLAKAAGYKAAVAVKGGFSSINTDIFQLSRFTPWDRDMPRFALRCGINLVQSPREKDRVTPRGC